jgi:hypothetical protein
MAQPPLPTPKDVRDLFSDLLGRTVEVTAEDVTDPRLDARASVGIYQDAHKHTVAVVTTDPSLSAHLAGCLALTPSDAAREVAASGMLPTSYAENLHEVLNIVGTLFNSAGTRPVRFTQMHAPGEQVPAQVATFAGTTGRRLDLTVSISGYGSGQMAVVT